MSEIKIRIEEKTALTMATIYFPKDFVDEINEYVDKTTIPKNKDYAHLLVGQIRQDKKSAQLDFPMDTEFGKKFKNVIDNCATKLLKQGFKRELTAHTYECWTVHSFSGDYNLLHDHGVETDTTPIGMSSVLYLKVPDCIKEKHKNDTEYLEMDHTNASGDVDGFTQILWGVTSRKEMLDLKHPASEYIFPEEGKMIIFPHWLLHSVTPFFGEGERRTLSANFTCRGLPKERHKS
tara:strand:- start:46 stop:750 length:705 start_codon:yes stop_codon:yes gene_type:complete